MVVDAPRGLPLDERGYEGNTTDVVALGPSLAGLVGPLLPQQAAARLTLVLDQGQGSLDHFNALKPAQFSCMAAIPAGWVRRVSQVSWKAYHALALAEGSRRKVSGRPKRQLGGTAGTLLVVCSPHVYRKQGRTLDVLQRKADQTLRRRQASVRAAAERHPPRTERAVRGEITTRVCHDRRKDCLVPTFPLRPGAVVALRWQWARRKKRESTHRDFGKTVLLTDRQELGAPRLVEASRSQARGEEMFRLSTSRRPGWWWPASHGTDGTLQGHALSCFLARLMIRMGLLRLHERHRSSGVDLLLERLQGIEEALVVYANGAAQRVLTERRPEQEARFMALDIETWAQQLGHTVLHP
ncbi:MAG TPA: hypothetical protein VFE93_12715 [Myxococcaceae bacterium]|nr:hypothetical protein [Myxococcaceae bacterium]